MKVTYEAWELGRYALTDEQKAALRNCGWLYSPLDDTYSTEAETPRDAILAWEVITGLDSCDPGYEDEGAHVFWWGAPREEDYTSGDATVQILFPGFPRTLREAAEKYWRPE